MQSTELDLSFIHSQEELEGYETLPPGTYHFLIERIEERDHDSFYMHCKAVAGTTGAHGNLRENITLPGPHHRDGGKFCARRLAKLALATELLDPSALGQSKVQVDWSGLEGRQFIAEVIEDHYARNDGSKSKSAKLNGLKIFHLKDPQVQDVPTDPTAIEQLRRNPPQASRPRQETSEEDPWGSL